MVMMRQQVATFFVLFVIFTGMQEQEVEAFEPILTGITVARSQWKAWRKRRHERRAARQLKATATVNPEATTAATTRASFLNWIQRKP